MRTGRRLPQAPRAPSPAELLILPPPTPPPLSRPRAQDAHTVAMSLPNAPGTSFFAVYDGHGGSLVSTVASTAVLAKVLASPDWAAQPRTPEKIGEAMRKGFLAFDEEM